MHPFEKSKLGKAPFKLDAIELADSVTGRTTCDHCGTKIKYVHWITSEDGNLFKVGSACVMKTDDKPLKDTAKFELENLKRWLKLSPEQQETEREFFANCSRLNLEEQCSQNT